MILVHLKNFNILRKGLRFDILKKYYSKDLHLHKTPSQHQINILIKSYQSQNYKKTKQLAILLTKKFPHHLLGWKVLSIALKRKGEI